VLILIGAFVGGLIVFHLLEHLAPIHPSPHGVGRKGYFADFTSAIVNGPVLSAITKLCAFWCVTLVPTWSQAMTAWPWALQFALFFVANDFGRYWLHRWYHEYEWLWRIHRVHHTISEMDSLSVIRIHILEAVVKNFALFVPFQVLGIGETVIVAYSAIDIVKGFWHHANLKTYIGPLNYVLNSAELHWWHHSVESKGHRANYGSILSIWDWLFHTVYWPEGEWPAEIGIRGLEDFPLDYAGQFTSIAYDDATLAERLRDAATSAEELGESLPVPIASRGSKRRRREEHPSRDRQGALSA
jgi:sterol desaturase/sphingolipid hydroxylase (fatty acid hydroxylase superfamily)